jgi:hypothetical protein
VKGKPVVYLKGSKLKRIKNSKAGRKFIIAATAFVALAVPATANATVNLHVVADPMNSNIGGAIIRDNITYASFAGANGWHPVKDAYGDPICNSQGAWDDAGNLVLHQFNVLDGSGFFAPPWPQGAQIMADWSYPNSSQWDPPVYIMHAGISCKMVKKVVSYKWVRRSGHRVRVRIVTHLHTTGIGAF